MTLDAEIERRLTGLEFQINGKNGTEGLVGRAGRIERKLDNKVDGLDGRLEETEKFVIEMKTTLTILKYLGGGIGIVEIVNFVMNLMQGGRGG